MNLAENIRLLWEQKEAGILTPEEFTKAKSILLNDTNSVRASTLASQEGKVLVKPTVKWETIFDRQHTAEFRLRATQILRRILENIVNYPCRSTEAADSRMFERVRQLKSTNAILRRDIFTIPRIGEYLSSIGFESSEIASVEFEQSGELWSYSLDTQHMCIYDALSDVKRYETFLVKKLSDTELWSGGTVPASVLNTYDSSDRQLRDELRLQTALKNVRHGLQLNSVLRKPHIEEPEFEKIVTKFICEIWEDEEYATLDSFFRCFERTLKQLAENSCSRIPLSTRAFRTNVWDRKGGPELLIFSGFTQYKRDFDETYLIIENPGPVSNLCSPQFCLSLLTQLRSTVLSQAQEREKRERAHVIEQHKIAALQQREKRRKEQPPSNNCSTVSHLGIDSGSKAQLESHSLDKDNRIPICTALRHLVQGESIATHVTKNPMTASLTSHRERELTAFQLIGKISSISESIKALEQRSESNIHGERVKVDSISQNFSSLAFGKKQRDHWSRHWETHHDLTTLYEQLDHLEQQHVLLNTRATNRSM